MGGFSMLRSSSVVAGSWWCSAARDDRDAEVGDVGARRRFGAVERGELGSGGVEADVKSLDLAEPPVVAGLGDAVCEVADDRDEAWPLLRVDAQHGTADAGVLVFAGAAVGPSAGAQFQLAQLEVFVELAPLVVGGFAVLGLGPNGAALVKEGPVGADQVVLKHGGVCLGGGEVGVPEQSGDDV